MWSVAFLYAGNWKQIWMCISLLLFQPKSCVLRCQSFSVQVRLERVCIESQLIGVQWVFWPAVPNMLDSAEHGHCSNARAISETIFTLRSRFSIHVYSVPLWNWSIDPWLPSGKHTKKYGKSPFLRGKSTISMAIFNSKLLNYQRVAWTQPGMITSPLRKRKNGTPTTSKPMFFVFSWIIIISISQKLIMNFVIFLFFYFVYDQYIKFKVFVK